MYRSIAIATLALLAVMTSAPAQAQQGWDSRQNSRYGSGINTTQSQLQARINSGVNSGRLTQREASRLQSKLNHIANIEARMRASGNRLSFGERQRLNNQLSQLSADITQQMNDFERRFAHRRGGWR